MKKINIIKKNESFGQIIMNNKPFKYKSFMVYVAKNTNDVYKFGLSVSKKLCNAVGRNKIKRQIKYIIDQKEYKNNFSCIIIIRKSYLDNDFETNKNDLEFILKKFDIYK